MAQTYYVSDYKRGLFWTLIDSVGSQGLVILFHLIYRTYGGTVQHGILGCLLSLTYLITIIANLGLDSALAAFLETFSASRKRFWLLTQLLLIPQAILLICLCLLSTMYISHIPAIRFFSWLAPHFSHTLLTYILLIFFLESMRKTLRTLLQLCFYFRSAALIELLGVAANIVGILLLQHYQQLTLLHTLQVLMYAALGQLALLLGVLLRWYSTLPQTDTPSLKKTELFIRISKTRLFSWILNAMHQLYSGNFLVPVCAFHFGIESASLMKVITSISYWITLIAKKALGVTSNAILAHLKSRSQQTQAKAFHFLSDVFNQVLYGLLIFLIMNGQKILSRQLPQALSVGWSLLYGMVLLTFLESLFVLYEKWYIVEEDAHIYVLFNILSIGLLYASIQLVQAPLAIISLIICIRVLTFIALSIFSFYRWNIWPSFKPYRLTLALSFFIAGLGYFLL